MEQIKQDYNKSCKNQIYTFQIGTHNVTEAPSQECSVKKFQITWKNIIAGIPEAIG